MKQILYTIAKNEKGELTQAVNATKSSAYSCLICSQLLILKKSIAAKRRPHFAHKTLTPNCTPESALHEGFKNSLANKINLYIKNGKELKINWNCENCYYIYRQETKHEMNLISNIREAKIEFNLGACRPDISLVDINNKVVTAIEIVVTHYPEENTENYYRENKINLIRFDLKGDEDFKRLSDDNLKIDFTDLCLKPKCEKCGSHLFKMNLEIIKTSCWKCRKEMMMAVYKTEGQYGYSCLGENDLKQIGYVKSKGVYLTKRNGGWNGDNYLANTCKNCSNFIGMGYLDTYGFEHEMKALENIDEGYHCDHCGGNFI